MRSGTTRFRYINASKARGVEPPSWVGAPRPASSCGRPIEGVGGYCPDAQFGRNRVDRLLRDVEVHLAVGGEVRADVALVVLLRLITREPVEEPGDVVDGHAGLFGKGRERAL